MRKAKTPVKRPHLSLLVGYRTSVDLPAPEHPITAVSLPDRHCPEILSRICRRRPSFVATAKETSLNSSSHGWSIRARDGCSEPDSDASPISAVFCILAPETFLRGDRTPKYGRAAQTQLPSPTGAPAMTLRLAFEHLELTPDVLVQTAAFLEANAGAKQLPTTTNL